MSSMVWGTLFAALVAAHPPGYVVYHYGPDLCGLPAAPAPMIVYEVPCCVQTIPSPALALVPVPVDPPTATTAVVQDSAQMKSDDAVTEEASAKEGEESLLEDAAFGVPGGLAPRRTLDHLALGWGVSTIGNGTLYPTPGIGNYSGGFGGFGGGGTPSGGDPNWNNGANWNMINNVLPPINIVCPCAPPAGNDTPPNNPVPEPASIAMWVLAAVGALFARRRLAT